MPTWPRTILPRTVSLPAWPLGLVSVGQSGKVQLRATTQVGREWTETYGVLDPRTVDTRTFLSAVAYYARNMTIFDVDHRSYRDLLGTGGGTPLVNGASQTGESLVTDGWTPSLTVLRAGDIIRIAGLNPVYEVASSATSDGGGNATLTVNPPIYTAPANNAAITINATPGSVLFRACIVSATWPEADVDQLIAGLTINFREAP